MTQVWIDGALVDAADAAVSPFDHGLLTGDGVFETLRVYDGTPFAVRRHLERLRRSADGLGLRLPDVDLREAMEMVVAANGVSDARLRLTVTGGVAPLGSDRGDARPTAIAAVGSLPAWPATTTDVVVPWRRNEHSAVAGLKTTSYAENVVALAYANERGAGEALFLNTAGHLCEGTGSNVFLVLDGELVTPPLSSGCLAGITRELVVELTGAAERDVPGDALDRASEVFITSSTREVQPVGRPGPVTADAIAALRALIARDRDP
ncbi:MAG: aminotransferase class IV [Actinobacteria bacterium]|nr:aminotransferase class IV [Actinomycetota bacterium]